MREGMKTRKEMRKRMVTIMRGKGMVIGTLRQTCMLRMERMLRRKEMVTRMRGLTLKKKKNPLEVEAYVWDLEWDAATGFGVTMSQLAAVKKSKKSAATSKSGVKFRFKPDAVGLAGTKRKVQDEDDHGTDEVAAQAGRRNPARNI